MFPCPGGRGQVGGDRSCGRVRRVVPIVRLIIKIDFDDYRDRPSGSGNY
jgi:hypothetical protein